MRSFSVLFVGVALAEESCSDGTCAQDEATLLQVQGMRHKFQALDGSATAVPNQNTQCWGGSQCGGQGGLCPQYCGDGACCRDGWNAANDKEREECGQTGYGISGMHTCQPARTSPSPGPPGPPGAQGAQGAQGTQGAEGAQGLAGARGAQGAQGPAGTQGARGGQGERGEQGSPGVAGAQGLHGEAGQQGAVGAPGSLGANGARGERGEHGDQGAQGPGGPPGERGEQGAQGAQGTQGQGGERGEPGLQGETGAQGVPGQAGEQGAPGPMGPAGLAGPAGEHGAWGEQGPPGRDGVPAPPPDTSFGDRLGHLESLFSFGNSMDGCVTDNSNSDSSRGDQTGEVIPFATRGPGAAAAVRCCSHDGSSCDSSVQGECHDEVTFWEAQNICNDAGMRLCSQSEMEGGVCCGTGCWYNHFDVWISHDGSVTEGGGGGGGGGGGSLPGAEEYIGCFVDDDARDLGDMLGGTGNAATNTFELCRASCDKAYMSLQYGGECFCADSYGNGDQYEQVDDSECNRELEPCTSTSHNCGGSWRQAIYQIGEPAPATGTTLDGCFTSNDFDGENPLMVHDDPEVEAAVRCCSFDGEECQSQDLPGSEAAPVLNMDGEDTGNVQSCWVSAHYSEALDICAQAGKRLCSVDEIDAGTCCGTGCWHDHRAIWIMDLDR